MDENHISQVKHKLYPYQVKDCF